MEPSLSRKGSHSLSGIVNSENSPCKEGRKMGTSSHRRKLDKLSSIQNALVCIQSSLEPVCGRGGGEADAGPGLPNLKEKSKLEPSRDG